MPDEMSAEWTADVLQQQHDSPLILGVGMVRPHTPLYVPRKYFDMYLIEEIQLPPTGRMTSTTARGSSR